MSWANSGYENRDEEEEEEDESREEHQAASDNVILMILATPSMFQPDTAGQVGPA